MINRQELDIKTLCYSSLDDFMVAFWEVLFLQRDANNLLAMLWTSQMATLHRCEAEGAA